MVEIPDKSFLQLCIELLKHESFHNNEREKKEGGGGSLTNYGYTLSNKKNVGNYHREHAYIIKWGQFTSRTSSCQTRVQP